MSLDSTVEAGEVKRSAILRRCPFSRRYGSCHILLRFFLGSAGYSGNFAAIDLYPFFLVGLSYLEGEEEDSFGHFCLFAVPP